MNEQELLDRFRDRYGEAATHIVRAPGRVNLIGEHIDYVGLPVFPIALQRRLTLAARPRSDSRIRASDPNGAFGERTFEISTHIAPGPDGDWENYMKGPARHLAVRRVGSTETDLRGFDAMLMSDIPIAAGLSSSAALVVATGLALASFNGLEPDPIGFAGEMADAERFVGTRGGGMDHAICLGAREGHASFIEFDPLRLRHTAVPRDWRFVVANTLERAEKAGATRSAYNQRPAEAAEALGLVREALGDGPEVGFPDLLSRHEVIDLFTIAARVLDETLLSRFRHIVTEGVRVHRAERAMTSSDRELFGGLMSASHASLRNDLQVSSEGLDRLCDIAMDAGAAGARLTGAGFGGCIVALCDPTDEVSILDALEREYYQDRPDFLGQRHAFVTKPSAGAGVEPL